MNPAAADSRSADHRLLRQVAAGDERAFDELYQTYHANVFNFLLRLVNESAVAEELLQEVFLAAWRGAGRFREEAKVKTWLLRIAHHQAVSWLRRHRRVSALDEVAETADDDLIEDRFAQMWDADQIRAALDRLSPNHRAVIELTYVHELSYAEIADVMNCPVGTVKSRMSYALRHLNVILMGKNEQPG
jgi:RNA polymerase sigma-70 factor (ECF subfamily)